MKQLLELTQPFTTEVNRKAGASGGDYVSHQAVTQRVLAVLGGYNLEQVEPIRGYAPEETINKGKKNETKLPAQDNVIVGALVRIRFVMDGQEYVITEAGDVEFPLQKANDGARLKDAISDGVKRCWQRVGVGLHLKKGDYTLHDDLKGKLEQPEPRPAKTITAEDAGRLVKALNELGLKHYQQLLLAEVFAPGFTTFDTLTKQQASDLYKAAENISQGRAVAFDYNIEREDWEGKKPLPTHPRMPKELDA
jgi:hypothetical protein